MYESVQVSSLKAGGMMNKKVRAVQKMQDFIETHLEEKITLSMLADAAGLTEPYVSRTFRELVGMAPSDYIRARQLTHSVSSIGGSEKNILEVAMDTHFETHEGYLKAFKRQFGINPYTYRKSKPPIPLFFKRSARDLYLYSRKGDDTMNEKTVFVQVTQRPERRLIVQRGKKATHYFEYCDEVGCDVWGILSSVQGSLFGKPVALWLPRNCIKPGTSEYVQGIEMPADYCGVVPKGMELIDLPACLMMEFHGEPFAETEDESGMEAAIHAVQHVIALYKPERFGYRWDTDANPHCQYEPDPVVGYCEAVPVIKI